MMIFGNRRKSEDEPPEEETKNIVPASASIVPPLRTNQQEGAGFETVLGTTTEIQGTLKCSGNIRLDGVFTGSLQIMGNVLVGEAATINADIHANHVSIAGTVRGNVSGQRVQLLRTARIWGDITAKSFSTDEGAFIDGKISMPEDGPTDAEHGAALPGEIPTEALELATFEEDDDTHTADIAPTQDDQVFEAGDGYSPRLETQSHDNVAANDDITDEYEDDESDIEERKKSDD